jgi:hypothetical protein
MNENKTNKMPKSVMTDIENDYLDEAFLYENALKNLQREIEEKQKILHKLQNKVNPPQTEKAKTSYYSADEYEYRNKDMVQKIKDEAADVLISELKNISSHLKRKLDDIDEKERRISSRLIELEEKQAIMEEIDYVQRMIPKKIIDEKIHSSVATKQANDVEIEDMFRPAVNMIAEKSNKLQKLKKETVSSDKKNKSEKIKDMIYVPSHTEEQGIYQLKSDQIEQTEQKEFQKNSMNGGIEEELSVTDTAKLSNTQSVDSNIESDAIDAASNEANVKKKAEPVRETKNIKDITSKPERKGMSIQQRDWNNFAYIKDSKVKLKQDDLLDIHKTIADIEQGRISVKGI